MTDREMLELAARATGYNWRDWTPNSNPLMAEWPYDWNPLTDDGDALRLAVKLSLNVQINQISVNVYYGETKFVGEECLSAGRDAATRRAIVRAAADIGKAMGVGNE
jgi:hypothetical protein